MVISILFGLNCYLKIRDPMILFVLFFLINGIDPAFSLLRLMFSFLINCQQVDVLFFN